MRKTTRAAGGAAARFLPIFMLGLLLWQKGGPPPARGPLAPPAWACAAAAGLLLALLAAAHVLPALAERQERLALSAAGVLAALWPYLWFWRGSATGALIDALLALALCLLVLRRDGRGTPAVFWLLAPCALLLAAGTALTYFAALMG